MDKTSWTYGIPHALSLLQEAEGFQPDLERDRPVAEPRLPQLQLPPPQRRREDL